MTARAWVTHFDHRYAARGLTMLQSLRRHDPDAALAVVALDEEVVAPLRRHAPWALVVRREELERRDPRLAALREAKHASYAALKPHGIAAALAALEARAPVDLLLFADADLLFYAPPGPALAALEGASVGLSPQRFNAVTRVMRWSGAYNAGLVAWRTDEVGRRCLREWGEDCLAWCGPEPQPDGRWMNQGYLDRWPTRYPGVVELTHPGLNLAPWNLDTHTLELTGGGPLVDGAPLVAFHHSGLTRDPALGWVARTRGAAPRNGALAVRHLVRPYCALLDALAARLEAEHGFSGAGRTEPLALDDRECVLVDPPPAAPARAPAPPAAPAAEPDEAPADAPAEAPAEALIVLESAGDRASVATTLAAIGDEVQRVLLLGDPAWSDGLAWRGDGLVRRAALEEDGAWLAERRGRDLLLVAGAAALTPSTLPALRAAARAPRVGAASAASAGGRVLLAPWAESGPDGRPAAEGLAMAPAARVAGGLLTAAAEPACALFTARALDDLGALPPAPAGALADRLSVALAARGWQRVAAAGAVAFTRRGWRPGPAHGQLEAALRSERRARGVHEAACPGGVRSPRIPRVALDLTGARDPARAEGVARAVVARLGGRAAAFVVTDDPGLAARLPARVQLADGWAGVPTGWFDAALRPGPCLTRAHVLELARGARCWSLVLEARALDDLDALRARDGVERRALLELALAHADRVVVHDRAAREALAAHLPELLGRLLPGEAPPDDLQGLAAELEAALAAPARPRPVGPLDPEALLGPSDLRPTPHPVTAWVARRLAWSPFLSSVGKRALDRVRALGPGARS